MDAAAETLERKDLGEVTWLEQGLREASQGMCRDVLRWLLALPGLRVPGDRAEPGERRVAAQERTVRTLFGEVRVSRNYYHSPEVGTGRFPLDEALGLVDGYTPGVAALIGRCAAEHPFGRAEAAFRAYTGLEVDARQFPRLAALLGPAADAFLRGGPASGEVAPPRAYVAADGTGAPLRHEELAGREGRQPDGSAQTHEIKVGAVFTQHPAEGEKPWRDLGSTTYVATALRAGPFGGMLRGEFARRFPDPPRETVFLADGAAWAWELQRVNFPEAVGVVDFYHAAEHVAGVADLAGPRDTPEGRRRRRRWVKLLLRGRLDQFLAEARKEVPAERRGEAEKALAYFERNRERMRYKTFRDRGYFIGSGVVEAACKTLVAQRLKCSGMHWSEKGLANILALRTAILSNRYDDLWLHFKAFRNAS